MISPTSPLRQPSSEMSRAQTTDGSYVDWAAILAGGVFALALSFLLISFGTSVGLSLTSPYRGEGVSAAWVVIAAGIWFAWVMVTGFGAGGYLAGRMRRRAGDATASEVEARDAMHGLMVWATGALVGTVLAGLGVGGLLTTGASAVGTVVDAASEAASSDYFANVMLRNAAEPGTQPSTGADAAAAPVEAPTPTADTIDPAAQQQIAAILARGLAEGDVAERDRSYLARLVAANSDLDATAARTRVDEVLAEIDEARAAALDAVEKARVAGVVLGFIAAATLLTGAVAAAFAAAAGGRHRDEGLGLDIFAPRR